ASTCIGPPGPGSHRPGRRADAVDGACARDRNCRLDISAEQARTARRCDASRRRGNRRDTCGRVGPLVLVHDLGRRLDPLRHAILHDRDVFAVPAFTWFAAYVLRVMVGCGMTVALAAVVNFALLLAQPNPAVAWQRWTGINLSAGRSFDGMTE